MRQQHVPDAKLRPMVVGSITYRCRDIGYGVERDIIQGYWTGDIDTCGKYTIKTINRISRPALTLYLFADEIESVEYKYEP